MSRSFSKFPFSAQHVARARIAEYAISFFRRDITIKNLLLALTACLFAFQYHTLAKLSAFHPATSHVSLTRFFYSVREQSIFDYSDGLLLALILSLGLAIIIAEWQHRALSSFLQESLRSDKSALLLLGIVSLVCVRYYFARGALHWSGDAAQHIAYVEITARELALFNFPTWTFAIGNGSPYLQNYGSLFFYLAGLFTLAVQDLNLGIKLCLVFAHVLSGLGMFLFIRHLTHSRRAGFFAGLAFVLSFWHVQQVLIMGRLPLALFYGLLPFAFWAIEMLARSGYRIRAASIGAIALASLFFTHPGYATYAALSASFYAAVRLWSWRRTGDWRERFYSAAALLVGGAILSSYMTIGMWAERIYTNTHSMHFGLKTNIEAVDQVVPDPSWQHLFVWSNYRFWLLYMENFHWYGGYLGLTLVALALVGCAAAYGLRSSRSSAPYAAVALCLFCAAWVVFAYRIPPVSMLHLLQNMNAARYLLFLVFFLSAAAGLGTHALRIVLRRHPLYRRLFALLLVLLFADLGTTTFIHPYMALDRNPTAYPAELFVDVRAQAQAEKTERGQLAPYRILWPKEGNNYLNVATTLHLSKVPTADAFHPGELRALDTFTRPFIERVRQEFSSLGKVEDLSSLPTADYLRAGYTLLNARHVMLTLNEEGVVYFFLYRHQSPIISAPQITPFDGELTPFALIDSMVILPARAQSQRILVRDIPRAIDLGNQAHIEVLDHRVYGERVHLQVRTDRPCFARLAYAYFPFLEITVDGQPVSFMQTTGRFIALKLDAGEHTIAIKAHISPLRRNLLIFSLIVLITAAVLIRRERRSVAIPPTTS